MLPRATRRLTERTATNPAKSLLSCSVSRTVSLGTDVPPRAGIFGELGGGVKGGGNRTSAAFWPARPEKTARRGVKACRIAPAQTISTGGGSGIRTRVTLFDKRALPHRCGSARRLCDQSATRAAA